MRNVVLLSVLSLLVVGCSGPGGSDDPTPTQPTGVGYFRSLNPSPLPTKAKAQFAVIGEAGLTDLGAIFPATPDISATTIQQGIVIAGGSGVFFLDKKAEHFYQINSSVNKNYNNPVIFELPDKKILVAGGVSAKDIHVYDPSNDWNLTVHPNVFTQPLWLHSSVINLDADHLLFVGGQAYEQNVSATEVFKPVILNTSSMTSEQVDGDNPLVKFEQMKSIRGGDGNIYVFGGVVDNSMNPNIPTTIQTSAILKFNQEERTFEQVGAMNWPLIQFGLVSLDGNTIGIYGGRELNNGVETIHSDVQYFNLTTKTVTLGNPLFAPRIESNAELLQNGKTLHIGSADLNSSPTDYQIWHSNTESNPEQASGVTGTMIQNVAGFTAVTLRNGRVAVIGGKIDDTTINNTAQIYEPNNQIYIVYPTNQIQIGTNVTLVAQNSAGIEINPVWGILEGPAEVTIDQQGNLNVPSDLSGPLHTVKVSATDEFENKAIIIFELYHSVQVQ